MQITKSQIKNYLKTVPNNNTRSTYGSCLKMFSEFCDGQPDFDRTEDYIEHLAAIGRKRSTIGNTKTALSQLGAFVEAQAAQTATPAAPSLDDAVKALFAAIATADGDAMPWLRETVALFDLMLSYRSKGGVIA